MSLAIVCRTESDRLEIHFLVAARLQRLTTFRTTLDNRTVGCCNNGVLLQQAR